VKENLEKRETLSQEKFLIGDRRNPEENEILVGGSFWIGDSLKG
jgi:hypothetical protein